MANDTPYRIEKDEKGLIRGIYRCQDGQEIPIPIDADGREYCRFVTWACNQSPPVAGTFGNLERGAIYLSQEEDLISLCRRKGIVLFVEQLEDGRQHLSTGLLDGRTFISLGHDPTVTQNPAKPGRFYFYSLYRAAPMSAQMEVLGASSSERLPVFVTHTLLDRLNRLLQMPDSDIRRVSSWPAEKTFVYFDISGFSQHPVCNQALIINALLGVTNDEQWWEEGSTAWEARSNREASLCIGDGYIFVFGQAHTATYFAAYLAHIIEQLIARERLIEFHFRIGIHTGPVYRFWDWTGASEGRWNYVGKGITEGERVLTAIGGDQDDVLFISAETRQRMLPLPQGPYHITPWLLNRGRRADKHGELRRVYEVNHTGWTREAVEERVILSTHRKGDTYSCE